MARFSSGALTAGAGSTTLPLISLYALAGSRPTIREIGISNITAVAAAYVLKRLTATGTQGGALVNAEHVPNSVVNGAAFNTHTVNPTLGNDLGYRCQLGAAVGSGWVWTFGDAGLLIPVGLTNGIGILVENGTGQILQAYIVWD